MKRTIIVNLSVGLVALVAAYIWQRGGWGRSSGSGETGEMVVEAKTLPPGLTVMKQSQDRQAAVLKVIESETDESARDRALNEAVAAISSWDRPAFLATLFNQNTPAAAQLRDLLVRRWAETDPSAAAAWVTQLPPGSAAQSALQQVGLAWANVNLAGAMKWLGTVPEGSAKEAVTLDIAYEAARTDPVSALRLASPLPDTLARNNLLSFAVSQWAETDASTAGAWVAQIADDVLRQQLEARVAVALAGRDGAAAATIVGTALTPGPEQDRTAVSIVQRWAQTSPQTAAEWIMQFPDSPVRDSAARNLMAIWTPQDTTASSLWLNSLPAGSLRASASAAQTLALASLNSTVISPKH